ncbi:hypothetical protein FHS31_003060 [Sphingomonas vulcanisoli]|uniref:DUF3489 domain-containing protein n=1 Tax=Sphingomonas vulcanisoli TaxID=1658060 RepID=A0ABX0TV66_9SPHN|nr:DUF3489 domain-containing protein [Sphingomonas vulcanisoli]NIJ09428.1 hypothetical protein [Sphingomonas vulcanisoli]
MQPRLEEKSGQAVGLVITDLGRAALDTIETEIGDVGPAASKIGHVIKRLRSPEGISLAEISIATGWQPHSARAALTTLRKTGFCIDRAPDDGGNGSRYWIAEEAAR